MSRAGVVVEGGQVARGRRRYALFGGPLDTGNLGVSALGLSTVHAVTARAPGATLTVFDNGRGPRVLSSDVATGATVVQRGAWLSRRLHRTESLYTMYAASRVASGLNANVRVLSRADAILDVSGGDSFSDIYGAKRFAQVTLPKRIALQLGRPLVLLPQTYGPFEGADAAATAANIATQADQAWARDRHSYERLVALVGDAFDPARHRQGVDVAFALPVSDPGPVVDGLRAWLDDDAPVVGLNVSGLLANDPDEARRRFGLQADQREVTRELVRRWLAAGVRVLLVPHVRGGSAESDDRASTDLLADLGHPAGLTSLPAGLGARETKWIISRTSWFAGARMHATIAALSTRVPVAGIAYSDKMRGVFESCGVADEVLDARTSGTPELTDALWSAWERRDQVGRTLATTAPDVVARAEAQFDDILGTARPEAMST